MIGGIRRHRVEILAVQLEGFELGHLDLRGLIA
jgi:hypothetical protein